MNTAHPIDTEALRRLADAATGGPWERNGRNGIHTPIGSCIALTHRHDPEQRQDDADFIAAARNAFPQLLDKLDQAEARIKAVRELHTPFEDKDCGTVCAECSYFGGDYGLYPTDYPCDTIRALDGTS